MCLLLNERVEVKSLVVLIGLRARIAEDTALIQFFRNLSFQLRCEHSKLTHIEYLLRRHMK